MQEGFPFKKKIQDRGYVISTGGDGRWLYVSNATTNRFDIFDGSLINSSNVSGGAWIVNPFVKSVTMAVGSSGPVLGMWYSAKYNSLYMSRGTQAGGIVSVFNTETEAQSVAPFLVYYNALFVTYHDDIDVFAASNNNGGIDNFQRTVRPVFTSRIMVGYSPQKIIRGRFFQRSVGFISPETLLVEYPLGNTWMGDAIVYNGFIISTQSVNGSYVYVFSDEPYSPYYNNQKAIITITGHNSANCICLCTKEKKAYIVSTAGATSVIDLQTMTFLRNVTGSTGVANSLLYHEFSNTVVSTIANTTRVRVIDCTNDTLLPDLTTSATIINNTTAGMSLLAANRTRFDG